MKTAVFYTTVGGWIVLGDKRRGVVAHVPGLAHRLRRHVGAIG